MIGKRPASRTEPVERKLYLIGGGKMGLALLKGWPGSGRQGSDIVVVDPASSAELRAVVQAHGISHLDKIDAEARADIVVLATKPQIAEAVSASVAPAVDARTLVISIMAGTSLAALRACLPRAAAVVRAMPNLAAAVGRGVVVAIAESSAGEEQRTKAKQVLEAAGDFEWLDDERLMDSVTGLSGSGPAYILHLVECLARAGIKQGLDPRLAQRLARSTAEGTGALLHLSPQTPEALREQVTSPKGTTEAGLRVLMDGRLQELIDATVEAATARSREL